MIRINLLGPKPRSERTVRYDAPTRRGGGGAWRAFVHVNSVGQPFSETTFMDLSVRYAQLSREETEYYRDLGAFARARHGQGYSSFPRERFFHVNAIQDEGQGEPAQMAVDHEGSAELANIRDEDRLEPASF